MLDVTTDLLSPQQTDHQLRIINARLVRTTCAADRKPSLRKQLDGGLLQRARRQSDSQNVGALYFAHTRNSVQLIKKLVAHLKTAV